MSHRDRECSFFWAIHDGKTNEVRAALEKDPSLASRRARVNLFIVRRMGRQADETMSTLEIAAQARVESAEVISLLLDAGQDPNQRFPYLRAEGELPTIGAALHALSTNESSSGSFVPLLCRAGADVKAADSEGQIPLEIAISEGSTATVRALLAHGAAEDLSPLELAELSAALECCDDRDEKVQAFQDAGVTLGQP